MVDPSGKAGIILTAELSGQITGSDIGEGSWLSGEFALNNGSFFIRRSNESYAFLSGVYSIPNLFAEDRKWGKQDFFDQGAMRHLTRTNSRFSVESSFMKLVLMRVLNSVLKKWCWAGIDGSIHVVACM